MEMSRVLEGMANPNRERAIRTALATDMMGVDGEKIEALQRDEGGWEEWLSRFREYYELWEKQGFIRMFRYFLLREAVRSRLLSLPNGERRLTNVLHLSEVLHQAAMEEKLGIVGLLKWLARQRDPGFPSSGRAPASPGKQCPGRESSDHPQEQGVGVFHCFLPL